MDNNATYSRNDKIAGKTHSQMQRTEKYSIVNIYKRNDILNDYYFLFRFNCFSSDFVTSDDKADNMM